MDTAADAAEDGGIRISHTLHILTDIVFRGQMETALEIAVYSVFNCYIVDGAAVFYNREQLPLRFFLTVFTDDRPFDAAHVTAQELIALRRGNDRCTFRAEPCDITDDDLPRNMADIGQ